MSRDEPVICTTGSGQSNPHQVNVSDTTVETTVPHEDLYIDTSQGRDELTIGTGYNLGSTALGVYAPVGGAENNSINSLGKELRKAKSDCGNAFIPLDALERLITSQAIEYELQKGQFLTEEEISNLTRKIFGTPTQKYSMIFTTLVLLSKTPSIVDLVKHGIHDDFLPFALVGVKTGMPQLAMNQGEETVRLTFFEGWSSSDHEKFFEYQWSLIARSFKLRINPDDQLQHYVLRENEIIPMISSSENPAGEGGFGVVNKVQFHSSHHNMVNHPMCGSVNPYFAVKKLKEDDEEAFKEELESLKRLGSKEQPHLVKLLATYEQKGSYYLIFPWADGGNLRHLWEKFPKPNITYQDRKLPHWLIKAILGIAEGLRAIHTCELDKSTKNEMSYNTTDVKKKHGAHGDLKPENILWFQDPLLGDGVRIPMGELKITDFGLTSFHKSETRVKFEPKGVSRTYCAPEFDVKGHISQKYDMWTLGCVLTEFVTWFLQGLPGLVYFEHSREEPTVFKVDEDCFFKKHKDSAMLKDSVKQHWNTLRQLEHSTQFTVDLVDFIEKRLLRMNPDNRCDIQEAVERLSYMLNKCESNDAYCTESPKFIKGRKGTDLSDSSVLSPSQGTRTPRAGSPRNSIVQEYIKYPATQPTEIGDNLDTHRIDGRGNLSKGKGPDHMEILENVVATRVATPHQPCEDQSTGKIPSPSIQDGPTPQNLAGHETKHNTTIHPGIMSVEAHPGAGPTPKDFLAVPQNPGIFRTSLEGESRTGSYTSSNTYDTNLTPVKRSHESIRTEKPNTKDKSSGCTAGLRSVSTKWLRKWFRRMGMDAPP